MEAACGRSNSAAAKDLTSVGRSPKQVFLLAGCDRVYSEAAIARDFISS